jgi:polysaccharide pyruvyl transferase WcaK-like protein
MKPITIEIHGTGTHNRGAELMAIAIAERMRATFPGARLVVPPSFGTFQERAQYEFYTTWEFHGRLRAALVSRALRIADESIKRSLGLVDVREVDVVLDASGFGYSDQWGPRGAEDLVKKMGHASRSGQRLIILPQAMGPFESRDVATASRKVFARAELVCARDRQSLLAVKSLGSTRNLVQFPDFTLGVRPKRDDEIVLPAGFAAIVPNHQMLDKTAKGEAYIVFLKRAIRVCSESGITPVFVLHDSYRDRRVIELADEQGSLRVVSHRDPRVLKGVLGDATLVISSRFHALVSALCQGVPCIGAGWSHKYEELFNDFDTRELLIRNIDNLSHLNACLSELTNADGRANASSRINAAAEILRKQTEEMWQKVECLIRQKQAT